MSAFGLIAAGWCVSHGIYSYDDYVSYSRLERLDIHPIWRSLWKRDIREGDDLEGIVARYPPVLREEFPPFSLLHYASPDGFEGLSVVAREGGLIQASASCCVWSHTFFERRDTRSELNSAYGDFLRRGRHEAEVFRIITAAKDGQQVFVGRLAAGDLPPSQDAWPSVCTLKVQEVIHGNLEVGRQMSIETRQWNPRHVQGKSIALLHFSDRCVVFPHDSPGDVYVTVASEALNTYTSLDGEEMTELELRVRRRQDDIRRAMEPPR